MRATNTSNDNLQICYLLNPKMNYFTIFNLQKKVEQQQWVAFLNKYFKQPNDNPTFQKICCKNRNQFKQTPQTTKTFMLLVSQKTQMKMKKNLLWSLVAFSFCHNHWTLQPQHMKCWALNLLKQHNFAVNRWTTSILPRFHKKTQTKRKRLTSTLLLALFFSYNDPTLKPQHMKWFNKPFKTMQLCYKLINNPKTNNKLNLQFLFYNDHQNLLSPTNDFETKKNHLTLIE